MLKINPEIFKIFSFKNPALKTVCFENIKFPLKQEDEEFIFKLYDTLRYDKGVYEKRCLALAAPQVGIFKRIFILGIGRKIPADRIMALINPEIIDKSKEVCDEYEGCLSIPKFVALVERPTKVLLKYQNIQGKIQKFESIGFQARIIQHEIDHLNGIHMLTKAKKVKVNELYIEYKERLKKQNIVYKSDEE